MTESERMFDAGKIGVFLDTIQHSTEDRRGTETKIIVLGLRVDPLDATLALVLDQRLRDSLFTLSDATARTHVRRVDAALGILRQNLTIYATPETAEPSLALLQCAISAVTAKVHKDRNEFTLTFKASFGPASKQELEYVEGWRGSQRFIAFERSEPSLMFDDDDLDETDEAEAVPSRPDPMWDDGEQPQAVVESEAAREVGSRPTAKRHKTSASKAAAAKRKPHGAAAPA